MGNCSSKKTPGKEKEPDKFFEREKWKEHKREVNRNKEAHPGNKRNGLMGAAAAPTPVVPAVPPGPGPAPPSQLRSYDDEALDRMRYQLDNDADAFLLNNILLSIQFFKNYEEESHSIRNNSISDRERQIDDAMVHHHKHVFFADRLQECVHEHVGYQRVRGVTEPLTATRLFVVYDNVEASEPGDTSDYSAVLDAPFYKLGIEDCKEPGYVSLKKIEVLESPLNNEPQNSKPDSDDSIYTDSEKESIGSDDFPSANNGEELLNMIKNKMSEAQKQEHVHDEIKFQINNSVDVLQRRRSGPVRQLSLQVEKNNISNINLLRKLNTPLIEEQDIKENGKMNFVNMEFEDKPRKSILKPTRRLSGPVREIKYKQNEIRKTSLESTIAEDTETSGYRSNSSSRHTESSENESDYGYATITESTTPRKIVLSHQPNYPLSSGVLPDECWLPVQVRTVDAWSDDDDEEMETASKLSLNKNLYETQHYLSSIRFMNNFLDNFMMKLGQGLGLTSDEVKDALTQGASIYCDIIKNGSRVDYEVFPALIAAWPNAANQWIIRERKIVQNPRTNFSYQWPTRDMVKKTIGFGCLLVPVGFRQRRGTNPEQTRQWRIIFPAAERYLESRLAHSHMRCYLFSLVLYKTFMENETSKIGIDPSHLKNHLFWECEDNYAKWPEDRLGETLRLFLKNFYIRFGQARFPNYFIENCNDFKSIPKPMLHKLQRRLADILEAPVMHVLSSLDKLKYTKKDFYPTFNVHKLYEILTSKNPLRILNPNLPVSIPQPYESDSDNERDTNLNLYERAKAHDKDYQWRKQMHRQIQNRKNSQVPPKKQKSNKNEVEIKSNIILPQKLETERRRLVLEFFIPHFIAMARSSEKFNAIKQAIIYLDQAQRLCLLLKDEPSGSLTAHEYLDIIRDKLNDCQRKLVQQGGYNLPGRVDSKERATPPRPIRRRRPRYEQIAAQDSPTDSPGIAAFTFAEVHVENTAQNDVVTLEDANEDEESKL